MKLKLNSATVSFLRSEVIITQEPESLEEKKVVILHSCFYFCPLSDNFNLEERKKKSPINCESLKHV